jgi:hypothetical protein
MTVESSIGPAPLPTYSEPESVIVASPKLNDGKSDIRAFDDDDGPSFSDLLDVINPLQHIPIINTIYREMSGDKEGAVADVLGGALWGGLIGLGAAVANLVVEDTTGKTVEGHVMALFSDDDSDTAVAKNDNATAPAASAHPSDASQPSLSQAADPLKKAGAASGAVAAAAGGPVNSGNFMVFGSASTPAPAKSAQSAQPITPTADALRSSDVKTGTSKESSSGPAQSGDFLVFGAGRWQAAPRPLSHRRL